MPGSQVQQDHVNEKVFSSMISLIEVGWKFTHTDIEKSKWPNLIPEKVTVPYRH